MSLDPRTPVLVGVGFAGRRCEDPREALEPVELMVEATLAAGRDSGAPGLLARAGSVRVPRGFWQYADPGRIVAERIGAAVARSVLAEIGILQQTLIDGSCAAIVAGEEDVAIIVGGEARYRTLRAGIEGLEVKETPQPGASPDLRLEPSEPFWADLEAARGLAMPVQFFALLENALRFEAKQGLDAHRDAVAALWSRMSDVAAGNPHAWTRERVPAPAIATVDAKNRMLAFPYTRRHNSSWNVDQASALLLCSLEVARAAGVPPQRLVFARSGTESNHVVAVSQRPHLARSPATAVAGEAALALAGLRIDEVEHLDLYSCFPAPVQIAARELGIDVERQLTVTGGMAFAGGPLNNYVLQATARMAEVLRADPGSAGLVTCVSGFMNKQGFGVWSTEPPETAFRSADCSEEVAARTPAKELDGEYVGPARVASYTVLYTGDDPTVGVAICDLPDGRRTVVRTEDQDLAREMTATEHCGAEVAIGQGGVLLKI